MKKIFHAAAARGAPGKGFEPISSIRTCIRNGLQKADELADTGIESILFPLMGTGQARGSLETTGAELLGEAIAYLIANPGCEIDHVYFLTFTDRELDFCRRFLDGHEDVERTG